MLGICHEMHLCSATSTSVSLPVVPYIHPAIFTSYHSMVIYMLESQLQVYR
jgi:hypothetical protein